MSERFNAATIERLISNIPAACKVLEEEGYVSLAGQLKRDCDNLVYWQERGRRAIKYRDLNNCLQNLVLSIRNAAEAIRFDGEYGPYESRCTEQWLRILEEFADTIDGYLELSRPEIVCLVGFSAVAAVAAWELEKKGKIALTLHLLPPWYTKTISHLAEAEGVQEILDELWLRKIDLADEVFVVNVGGYISDRTRFEIEYAEGLGKPVKYLEPLEEDEK